MTYREALKITYEKYFMASDKEDGELLWAQAEDIKREYEDDFRQHKKRSTKAERQTVLNRMYKRASEDYMTGKLIAAHPCGDKYGIFDDGAMLFVLNDSCGRQILPEASAINVNKFKPGKETKTPVEVDIADLSAFCIMQKAKIKIDKCGWVQPYILTSEDGKLRIGFNPFLLMDFCRFWNTDMILCSEPLRGGFYENDSGEWGLIMPIKLESDEK